MAYKRAILDSASSDLSAIVEQLITATGGKSAAASFLDDVDKTVNLITEFPTMSALSPFDSLAKRGYRSALVGSYALPYRFESDIVYIVHIFHQTVKTTQPSCDDYELAAERLDAPALERRLEEARRAVG